MSSGILFTVVFGRIFRRLHDALFFFFRVVFLFQLVCSPRPVFMSRVLKKQARKVRTLHLVKCSLTLVKKKASRKSLTKLCDEGRFIEDREDWQKELQRHCEKNLALQSVTGAEGEMLLSWFFPHGFVWKGSSVGFRFQFWFTSPVPNTVQG